MTLGSTDWRLDMSVVKTTIENGQIRVSSPYHSEFPKRARQIGGSWQASSKLWVFPEELKELVIKTLNDYYGESGLDENIQYITLTLRALEDIKGHAEDVIVTGRHVVKAYGRDSGAKMCDGSVLVSGTITSGGSVKNWQTIVRKDTVIKILNFNPALLPQIDTSDWEIITENHDALIAERENLMRRIAEIDAIIGGTGCHA